MKVAFIHDDLLRRGGAENVVKSLHELFPEAPIYTLAYQKELTYPEFKDKKIITSWFQIFAKNEFLMKWLFFPLGILAMKSLKVKGYDLVIISTTYCAKYAKIPKGTPVITYCYTPFRFAWNPESYNVYAKSKFPIRLIFNGVINLLRKIDKKAAARTDHFVAMTNETKDRIVAAYDFKKEIPIINPPVAIGNYDVSEHHEGYYLVVSRFEPYKRVDLVIDAFNDSDKQLIIVGRGSQEQNLKKQVSGNNIQFKSNLSNEELANLYENCKAFIFPQHEDYGITPLEANAAGKPVIAYGMGGVTDTMIPYKNDAKQATAVFFDNQTVPSLQNAIEEFEGLSFDPDFIRKNAEKFSDSEFKSQFDETIKDLIAQ